MTKFAWFLLELDLLALDLDCAMVHRTSRLVCLSAEVFLWELMLLLMTEHHLLYKLGLVTAINIVKYNLNTTKNMISEATVCILQKHLFMLQSI